MHIGSVSVSHEHHWFMWGPFSIVKYMWKTTSHKVYVTLYFWTPSNITDAVWEVVSHIHFMWSSVSHILQCGKSASHIRVFFSKKGFCLVVVTYTWHEVVSYIYLTVQKCLTNTSMWSTVGVCRVVYTSMWSSVSHTLHTGVRDIWSHIFFPSRVCEVYGGTYSTWGGMWSIWWHILYLGRICETICHVLQCEVYVRHYFTYSWWHIFLTMGFAK